MISVCERISHKSMIDEEDFKKRGANIISSNGLVQSINISNGQSGFFQAYYIIYLHCKYFWQKATLRFQGWNLFWISLVTLFDWYNDIKHKIQISQMKIFWKWQILQQLRLERRNNLLVNFAQSMIIGQFQNSCWQELFWHQLAIWFFSFSSPWPGGQNDVLRE